jgi:hypothetical protein
VLIVAVELLQTRTDQSPVALPLGSPMVSLGFPGGGVLEGDVAPGTYRYLRYSLVSAAVTVAATAHQGSMALPGTMTFDVATAAYTTPSGTPRAAGEMIATFSSANYTNSVTATVPLDCPLSEAGGHVETGGGTHRVTVPLPGAPLVLAAGQTQDLQLTFPMAGAVTWIDLDTQGFATDVLDVTAMPNSSETPARLPICDVLLSDRCEPKAVPNRSVPAWPMPDSATTTCTDGTGVTACPAPGAAGYGQDGNFANSPSQLVVSGDLVQDVVTGLVWQRVSPAQSYDWWAAREYCSALDLGGRQDWSLPSRIELASLLNVGRFDPSIDIVAFNGEPSDFFWTNSPALFSSLAFGIRFDQGFVYDHDPNVTGRVRCVAGGKQGPASRLVAAKDTVQDTATGLEWQRATQPAAAWLDALAACVALDLDGHKDWRLPTAKELLSIVEDRALSPSTDIAAFPNTPAEWFWSGSPGLAPPNYGWTVSFTDGFSTPAAVTQLYVYRCVRGP